jgi:uncharacterized protein YjbI with pentapeptide repeats
MSEFEETRQAMRELVLASDKLTQEEFEHTLLQHAKFLETGGAGGHWETFYIKNLIFGSYKGGQSTAGTQAKVNFRNLEGVDVLGLRLQYADCAGIRCENKSWAEADLEGSLFIDSVLNHCSFQYADLYATDFSRAAMQNCNFKGASLIETDFENCDLTGADFRGATINETTKFKGAILKDALFDSK